ncbi:MAG: hypothetical protein QXI86_08320 [Ignisphaera sp.]
MFRFIELDEISGIDDLLILSSQNIVKYWFKVFCRCLCNSWI